MPGTRLFLLLLAVLLVVEPAYGFDPDAPAGQAPPPTPAATPNAAPDVPTGPAPVVSAKPTSLFITPDELAKINDAIEAYKRMRESQNSNAESQAKNFLNQLDQQTPDAKQEPPKPKPFTYPQFFLQYLSFQNDVEWLVIVDGKKFAPGYNAPGTGLKVLEVTKESVQIEWTPENLDKVNEAWTIVNGEGPKNVSVDSIRGTVTFTLKPNQTFSSYAMRVVEGKVAPVTVMLQPTQGGVSGGVSIVDVPGKKAGGAETKVPRSAAEAAADDVAKAVNREAPQTTEKLDGAKGLSETYKKMGLEP